MGSPIIPVIIGLIRLSLNRARAPAAQFWQNAPIDTQRHAVQRSKNQTHYLPSTVQHPLATTPKPMRHAKGIGVLKALFPNFRKYRDQKTAKTKSQWTTPACVLSSSNPCRMKNRPDPPGNTEFSVRFALIHKLKTTTSSKAIASHFSRLC